MIPLSLTANQSCQQETRHRGRITAQPVSRLTGMVLTKQENMLLFLCTETTESKPVKQETSWINKLSLMESVSLWTTWLLHPTTKWWDIYRALLHGGQIFNWDPSMSPQHRTRERQDARPGRCPSGSSRIGWPSLECSWSGSGTRSAEDACLQDWIDNVSLHYFRPWQITSDVLILTENLLQPRMTNSLQKENQ